MDSIDLVLKLQHLTSCLESEAGRLLLDIKLTVMNLDVTCEILVCRYDNRRVRLHVQLKRLISAPAANPKLTGELTRLLDTFEESIRALAAQGRSVSTWNDWFVHFIVVKLDPTTRQDWGNSSHNGYATYEELTQFLEN